MKYAQQVISKTADGKRKVDKVMFQISARISRTPNSSTAKRRLISNIAFYPDKCIGQVHHLFDEIPHRDIFYLNSLLAAHVRSNEANTTWVLFQQMHRVRSDLDAYTFTPVLSACSLLSDTRRGRQVHSLITKNGSESETITKTALIDMYSKCNNFNESVQAFEEMKSKDVVAWNAMLSSFLRNGLAREALGVFKAMQREGVEFSGFSLCSVLKACASLKSLHQGKQVHALVIVMGSDLLVLGTALVDFYSSSGLARESMKVFSQLNCRKDDVIFNSLISGCVQNREYREAFSILSKMRPNIIALTSGLAACSEDLSLSIGKQIHCVAIRFRFQSDTQLCNALLDMYAKCGKISIARTVFDRIPCSDVVSWTSIIDAYRTQGFGAEALELFEKMEKISDVSPNAVTFLAVLSACGHSGLVEKGRECFVRMKERHGIDPGPEHYACLIDLLGRAGLIEEAWSLHLKMGEKGMKLTGAVWAALLNACRVNMDVVRGEIAAKNLFEIEPENPGNYVTLSNFYAAIGRWDRVEELRNLMREKGLTKEVGSSWIAVK